MINENIKKLRRERGLTQEHLANKLGVTRQTLSKWENGTSVPGADIVSKMASLLDVSVSDLLGCSNIETENKDYSMILAMINEELAKRNSIRKTILRIIIILLIVFGVGIVALIGYILFWVIIMAII